MRLYQESEETERLEFARKAAEYFEQNPLSVTFTSSGPEPGAYMALRWGLGNDCVAVFKIDEYEEIVNYPQFISRESADKTTRALHRASDYLKEQECRIE